MNITQEKIEKKNIISFYSKIDYDDAADSIDIEKDVIIMLNTTEDSMVNLSNTNIYNKNNDDILLLFKNHETNTIKRSDILRYCLKGDIKYEIVSW